MNQPAVNGGFAPQTLFLGLAASSLASSFLKTEELSARSFLLWGLPAALGSVCFPHCWQRSFRPGSFSLEKVSSPVWAAECPDSGLQWS